MIQINNTIRSIPILCGQLSSDENNSVYTPLIFFAMKSSSTNNTTSSSIISLYKPNIPMFYTSLSCVIIGLLMGLIIIFNKKLHAPSTSNTIIMIITSLILFTGVIILTFFDGWIYALIIELLSCITSLLALTLGGPIKVLRGKWRKILFGFACLFTLTDIIFTILGFVYRDNNLIRIICRVFSCASWCCVMFIVEFWSTWHLVSRKILCQYSIMFTMFTLLYECAILYFILQIVITVTGCERTCNILNDRHEVDSFPSYLHS
ncbi:hypothetical protein KSF78_0007845 [Schistosoma japonicum]|nr:hypothetical protein KSF78_0007845 [Schistosoma japonicum]